MNNSIRNKFVYKVTFEDPATGEITVTYQTRFHTDEENRRGIIAFYGKTRFVRKIEIDSMESLEDF